MTVISMGKNFAQRVAEKMNGRPKKIAGVAAKQLLALVIIATAIVAGVIVVDLAGPALFAIAWIVLYIAFQIAVGLAVGSLIYAASAKLIEMCGFSAQEIF